MPALNMPINDVSSSVERPVIFDVLRQLMMLTGISEKTPIRFYGGDAMAQQFNSHIGKLNKGLNRWPHQENLSVEVDEDHSKDHLLGIAVKQNENPAVFFDPQLNVMITPVYSPTDVSIRVKFNAKDKNQAQRWRDEVRTRAAMGREINMHELNYSYALPTVFEALLMHVYALREAQAPYGQTLNQWWTACADPRFTRVTNQAGESPTVVMAEKQNRIQGIFDFESVPEKAEREKEPDMWSLSFTYKFRYDKPIEMVCRYPLLIHQQPIGAKFRQYNNAAPMRDLLKRLTHSGTAFEQFGDQAQLARVTANKGVTWPVIDDWLPLQGTLPVGTLKIFTGMIALTPDDRRTLLDLRKLGDFSLIPEVLAFMAATEYPHMQNDGGSIFRLSLYEGHNVVESSRFEVTPALVVQAKEDLNLRKLYHVRLAIHADALMMRAEALARLRAQPEIANRLAIAINASLTMSGNARDLRKNKLNAHDLALMGVSGFMPPSYSYSLVQMLFIEANRLEDYRPNVPEPTAITHPYIPEAH